MSVKIIIPENSKTAKFLRQMEAEKEAFKKAVMSGKGKEYAKQHASKVVTGVPR